MGRWVRVLSALFAASALAGCGVQAGDEEAANCDSVSELAEIDNAMDEVDNRIVNLRPAIESLDDLEPLVDEYREATAEYEDLLRKAKEERDSTDTVPTDLVGAWDLLIRSLELRRDGIEFFANAFADPAALEDPSILERGREYDRRTQDLNAEYEEKLTAVLEATGFQRRADGSYEIDC